MWAAIIGAIVALFQWLCKSGGETAATTFDTVAKVGGGLLDGAVEWFTDEDTSMASKLTALAALGFVVAPDATNGVLTNVITGVGKTTDTLLKTVDNTVTSFMSSTTGKIVMIGLAAWLIMSLTKE
jgi:hypothetical protein